MTSGAGETFYREDERYWKPDSLRFPHRQVLDLGQGCYLEVAASRTYALFAHRKEDGSMCWGQITLGSLPNAWRVWKWDGGLTLEPSLECPAHRCHGWIRDGKWVPA